MSSGQISRVHGFTGDDGAGPDVWRYMEDVEAGRRAGPPDYR